MQKRALIAVISILALAIVAGGVWYGKNRKEPLVSNPEANQEQKEPGQKQQNEIDTSDWKTFYSQKYRFKLKYPNELVYAFQKAFSPSEGAKFLFYDAKFSDVAESYNPLLAIIDKNVGYLDFEILAGDFAKETETDIKRFLTLGAGGPRGEIYEEKMLDWESTKSTDGKTIIYFYTKTIADSNLGLQTSGAVWTAGGKLFILEKINDKQGQIGELYKEMALTFFQE